MPTYDDHDDCVGHASHVLSRRELLRITSHVTAAATGLSSLGAATLLTGCKEKKPALKSQEPTLKIGYLPITDAAPLLIGHAQGFFQQEGLNVDAPVLIRGWAEISEAFMAGTFNLVHLLLPIPIYMRFAQNQPVKVVAWNHTNGSALTVGLKSGVKRLEQVGGKQIAVPHWYSMHNILLQLCLRKYGIEAVIQDQKTPLKPNQTNLFVMKPPDMPTAMSRGEIDGYIVAEPFNAAGEVLAKGTIVRFTGDVFKNHPCCVAVMREQDIQNHPEWSQKVLNGLVRAQQWITQNREQAAQILSKDGKAYLPMPAPVITRAMTKYDLETYGAKSGSGAIHHPQWGVKRIDFQPYPFESATREIVKLLKQTRLQGKSDFLAQLDPERVVQELFDYAMVKKAADKVGGLATFEDIDRANPYVRAEVIQV